MLFSSLPPYNCDLSPIEECWKDTKHAVRQSNVDQNIKTIIEIATKVMNEYPADKWKAHIRHIERYFVYKYDTICVIYNNIEQLFCFQVRGRILES